MSEDISNPLLSLIKEQSLIDDLQYEEVLGEFKRTGKPVTQILQDFGVMDLELVVVDPAEVEKAIEKYYPEGEEGESVSELLKELGSDAEIAREVSAVEATDDVAMMAGLANEAPIVRFVNLVLFQAVQDRA